MRFDGISQLPNNIPLGSNGHGVPAIGVGRGPIGEAIMVFGGEHHVPIIRQTYVIILA